MANIIEVECPDCYSSLWIDIDKKTVIQHKKTKKRNFNSFDDLLLGEKKKKETVDERFIMAKDLEEAKKKKAQEIFNKNFE
jgi:hypothetical protein